MPRFVSFNTDGPSLVSATITNASAQVRVCMWMEPNRENAVCRTTRNGSIDQVTTQSDSATWTVALIANGSAPTATLGVQFNALEPSVTLDSFRFNGTSAPDYNGFDLRTDALMTGDVSVQASFDDGSNGAYAWHLVIAHAGGDAVLDKTGDPSQTVDETQSVDQGSYRISLSDPDEVANPAAAVIVTATISWP